jgi:hypothetical protein
MNSIYYLKHADINKQLWDGCVEKAFNGLPYAYSWYLDIAAPGWDALILEDYEAVFPLPKNRKLLGFMQVYQPFFVQQLGLIGSRGADKETLQSFISAIPGHFIRVRLPLNEGNPLIDAGNTKMNLILGLSPPFEQLQKGFSKSLRKRVRRAKPDHQLHQHLCSPEELVQLYRNQIGQRLPLKNKDYQRMIRLIYTCLERSKGWIAGITHQSGELRTAGFFLDSHQRVINIFGASTEAGKAHHGMHLLLSDLIELYAGTDRVFDFEGSSIPSIAAFFRSFGAEEAPFSVYHRGLKG